MSVKDKIISSASVTHRNVSTGISDFRRQASAFKRQASSAMNSMGSAMVRGGKELLTNEALSNTRTGALVAPLAALAGKKLSQGNTVKAAIYSGAIGAAGGAAVGGGAEVARQKMDSPGGDINWRKVAEKAGEGALVSAIPAAIGGAAGTKQQNELIKSNNVLASFGVGNASTKLHGFDRSLINQFTAAVGSTGMISGAGLDYYKSK
jgi:hypothetical protein